MFITIDGPDGVGKTSVSQKLVELINSRDNSNIAVYTSEPTNSDLGKKIREILKSGDAHEASKLTEYFISDRADHVNEIVKLLSEKYIVICDRYKYSTIVYQHLQGEDITRLISLNKNFLKPHYSFILNVKSVDILLEHIGQRGLNKDLFENSETLNKAVALYNEMHQYFPDETIVYINAEQSIDDVMLSILRVLPEL